MKANDEAKLMFNKMVGEHSTKAIANYSALIELAKRIADADEYMLKIDPESVRDAVKNIIGVV